MGEPAANEREDKTVTLSPVILIDEASAEQLLGVAVACATASMGRREVKALIHIVPR